MSEYSYGPDVAYELTPTGHGAEHAERLVRPRCPSCGASWSKPDSVRVGHAGQREYRCARCEVFHRGVLVDDHGARRPTPGAGLAREQRARSDEARTHESGPRPHP